MLHRHRQAAACPSSAPFETRQVFTNREEHVRTCLRRFAAQGERSFTTGELLDFQRPASNVIAVAGEGGIGKSTLARHVAELAVAGEAFCSERRAGPFRTPTRPSGSCSTPRARGCR